MKRLGIHLYDTLLCGIVIWLHNHQVLVLTVHIYSMYHSISLIHESTHHSVILHKLALITPYCVLGSTNWSLSQLFSVCHNGSFVMTILTNTVWYYLPASRKSICIKLFQATLMGLVDFWVAADGYNDSFSFTPTWMQNVITHSINSLSLLWLFHETTLFNTH